MGPEWASLAYIYLRNELINNKHHEHALFFLKCCMNNVTRNQCYRSTWEFNFSFFIRHKSWFYCIFIKGVFCDIPPSGEGARAESKYLIPETRHYGRLRTKWILREWRRDGSRCASWAWHPIQRNRISRGLIRWVWEYWKYWYIVWKMF